MGMDTGKYMSWMRLIRWPNLAITAMIFAVFRYGFLYPLNVSTSLSDLKYFMLFLSVALVMAGGYIINDIHDRKADRINKKGKNVIGSKISETQARYTYWILSISGMLLGYFMGYTVGIKSIGSIHLIAFFLLWTYSTDFKHRPLLGNLVVSTLAGLVILVIPLFDVVPANRAIIEEYQVLFMIFGAYALFAMWNTLIRELIKDVEDVEGDKRTGSRTLAILYGQKTSRILIIVLIALQILALLYPAYLFRENWMALAYILIMLIFPLAILILLVGRAQERKDWHTASNLSKLIMVLGIFSVVVITLL